MTEPATQWAEVALKVAKVWHLWPAAGSQFARPLLADHVTRRNAVRPGTADITGRPVA